MLPENSTIVRVNLSYSHVLKYGVKVNKTEKHKNNNEMNVNTHDI